MEAEVVEKQLARRAYEDFLHRRRIRRCSRRPRATSSPRGCSRSRRNADKHLVISFSQELAGRATRCRCAGCRRPSAVDVRVQVRGVDGEHRRADAERAQLDAGSRRRGRRRPRSARRRRSRPASSSRPASHGRAAERAAEPPASVTLLVDTSASRALGFAAHVADGPRAGRRARARRTAARCRSQVVAFDQDTDADLRRPRRRDRATARTSSSSSAARSARPTSARRSRWLGEPRAEAAGRRGHRRRDHRGRRGRRAARRSPSSSPATASSGSTSRSPAASATTQAAARDRARRARAHRRRARSRSRRRRTSRAALGAARCAPTSPVAVDGARWVFPRTIAAAQRRRRGDGVRAARAAARRRSTLTSAGRARAIAPVGVTPALLERAVGGAEIAELEDQLATADRRRATQAARRDRHSASVAARVISSQTSMLVLEIRRRLRALRHRSQRARRRSSSSVRPASSSPTARCRRSADRRAGDAGDPRRRKPDAEPSSERDEPTRHDDRRQARTTRTRRRHRAKVDASEPDARRAMAESAHRDERRAAPRTHAGPSRRRGSRRARRRRAGQAAAHARRRRGAMPSASGSAAAPTVARPPMRRAAPPRPPPPRRVGRAERGRAGASPATRLRRRRDRQRP